MLKIAGYIKTSFVDYPSLIASVVFTTRCNMNCAYCHNKDLLTSNDLIASNSIIEHLKKRRDVLQGVVITGGEPTMHKGLPAFCRQIKALGYQIKLDTNGTNPTMLKTLISDCLIDYIAMDFKAPPNKYQELCGVPYEWVDESYHLIKNFKHYEFRTTFYPKLDLSDIREIIKYTGTVNYYLQQYRPNNEHDLIPYSPTSIKEFCNTLHIKTRGIY